MSTAALQKPEPGQVVRFNATAPVKTLDTLRGLVERQMESLRAVLPRHVTPERLIKTLFVAINRTPKLLECEQVTVMESLMRAGELGLDVSGTLGDAYLVPFKNQGRMQCQLIIGYRGRVRLMRQSGEVSRVDAAVVYKNDHFVFERGIAPKLEHHPLIEGDRGAVIGAWALVQMRDGSPQFDFMTRAEIERVRSFSKAANAPAWSQHWEEMAKKTVINRVSKLAPMSSERVARAIQIEEEEFDFSRTQLAALPDAPMLTSGMLAAAEPEPDPIGENEPAATLTPDPLPRISDEALKRINDAASGTGMTPNDLDRIVAQQFGGLALEDLEPGAEGIVMLAIKNWVKPKGKGQATLEEA